MKFPRAVVAIVLLFALPACSAATIDRTWNDLHDFQGLNTYDWAPKEPETGPQLPYDLIDRAVKRSVERVLAGRGLRRSDANPSFRVTYYVGVEEVEAITDDSYYGNGWGGYWGYGWYGPTGVNASQYDDGTLTVDVISADPAGGLVWRGVARGVIDGSAGERQMESSIDDAVSKLLEHFPPERK